MDVARELLKRLLDQGVLNTNVSKEEMTAAVTDVLVDMSIEFPSVDKIDGWFITLTEKNGEVKTVLVVYDKEKADEFVAKGYGVLPFKYV